MLFHKTETWKEEEEVSCSDFEIGFDESNAFGNPFEHYFSQRVKDIITSFIGNSKKLLSDLFSSSFLGWYTRQKLLAPNVFGKMLQTFLLMSVAESSKLIKGFKEFR